MKTAPLDPLARRVLRALYELAELDCPADAGSVARAVGLSAADATRVLLALDARGLVRAEHVRLTLLGLAHAARVPALSSARARPGSLAELRRCAGDGGPASPVLVASNCALVRQKLRQV
jgi:DNA-binding IclR family transcriptional regulator